MRRRDFVRIVAASTAAAVVGPGCCDTSGPDVATSLWRIELDGDSWDVFAADAAEAVLLIAEDRDWDDEEMAERTDELAGAIAGAREVGAESLLWLDVDEGSIDAIIASIGSTGSLFREHDVPADPYDFEAIRLSVAEWRGRMAEQNGCSPEAVFGILASSAFG